MMYTMVCATCGETFQATGARLYCTTCKGERRATENTKRNDRWNALIGQRYERLTILGIERRMHGCQMTTMARCVCDCGKEKWIALCNIKSGMIRSCGCLSAEVYAERGRSLAEAWESMRAPIIDMVRDNPAATYEQIAKEAGVTRQRVQQIVKRYMLQEEADARKRRGSALRREEREELERYRAAYAAQAGAHA